MNENAPPKERPQAPEEGCGLSREIERKPDHSATPRKWQRVLRWFVDGGSLNRFDAYRELRDSCLNTTVSQIERRGIRIDRGEESVRGAFGPVRCMRYRIAPDSIPRALVLLKQ